MALSAELAPKAAPHRVVLTALPSLTAVRGATVLPSTGVPGATVLRSTGVPGSTDLLAATALSRSAGHTADAFETSDSAEFLRASGSGAERVEVPGDATAAALPPATPPSSALALSTATPPGTIPALDLATTLVKGALASSSSAGIDPAVHPGELLAAAHVPAAVEGAHPGAVMAPRCPAQQASRDLESTLLPLVSSPVRYEATPLTANLYRLHVTVSRRFVEKLEAARDALSHAKARGTVDEVLESALDLLLRERARAKGIVDRPRKKRPSRTPGQIPAAVKREVWNRDGGCCQWPVKSGGVCGSTVRIEFDHVTPRARGGPSTVENLRLLCRAHNQLAARRVFGDEWMTRRAEQRSEQRAASARRTSVETGAHTPTSTAAPSPTPAPTPTITPTSMLPSPPTWMPTQQEPTPSSAPKPTATSTTTPPPTATPSKASGPVPTPTSAPLRDGSRRASRPNSPDVVSIPGAAHDAVGAPREASVAAAAHLGAEGLGSFRGGAGAAPSTRGVASTPRGSSAVRRRCATRVSQRAARARVCAPTLDPLTSPPRCREGPAAASTTAASSSSLRAPHRMYLLRSSSAMTPSRRRRT